MVKGDCWKWGGFLRKQDSRPIMYKNRYAYRVMYEAARGAIPSGVVCHHLCENPWCVNPWHIEVITQSEHLQRYNIHANHRERRKTHCVHGHPFDETNTVHTATQRVCKTCRRLTKQRYRARQKELTCSR